MGASRAEPGLGGGEAGEVAVGGRQEDELARRLAEIDRRLDVAAVGRLRAQEMHGGLALIGARRLEVERQAGDDQPDEIGPRGDLLVQAAGLRRRRRG